VRDAVLVNAAGAVAAYSGLGPDLVADMTVAMARVAEAVDSGAAEALLDRWAALSSSLSVH
jgi:anthranilate phosphoribosyltransferase